MSPDVYKAFGAIGFAISWFAIALLLFTQEVQQGDSTSHSQNAFTMTALLESVALTLFALFTVKWMAPTFNLPTVFSVFCTAIAVCMLIAAWFPVTGPQAKLHDFMAHAAALLCIPVVLILVFAPNISSVATFVNSVVLMWLVGITLLFIKSKTVRTHRLYFQSIYIFIFDIALLSAVYLR